MIPKNAIKKVRNDIHLEIAAGSLIAYGIFPQTQEGIQLAKETAASKDTWLAPSDLPEYYDGIDSDLITGKENDAIRAIRKTLKEFYGISSASTETSVDTRNLARPTAPSGIQIQWFSINQVGPTVWEKLKAQLTGKGYFSEVNLSEKDADELIANIIKSGEFPSLKNQSGIHNEVYQNWLVDTYLPNYGQTQVYNPGDKFVDDGKEFADKIVTDLDDALEEKSNEIMDDIDAIIAADKKKYEDFKKQLNRKVNHPELYEELQHIQPRYMWGQNGLYDLEFKSDIDRAIYFAGKLSSKDTPDKVAVRAWLKDVTGLDVREDYREVKEYRSRILALILQLVKLHPNEREVTVPPVYDGYYQDPEEEEEDLEDEEEMDDEEYDDLYGSSLDDLITTVRVEEEPADQEKEVEAQAETATQVLVEAEDAREEEIDESIFDDLPEGLKDTLVDIINKKKGKTSEKKKSNYVSNTKIFNFLSSNLLKIQGQLDSINDNISRQNQLLQANLQVSGEIYESIDSQNSILVSKLDEILYAIDGQNRAAEKFADDEEKRLAEQNLEQSKDVAGTEIASSTLGKGAGSGNSLFRRLVKFFGKKLASKIWTKFIPKRLRAKFRLARRGLTKLKSLPQRLAQKLGAKVADKVFKKQAQTTVKNVAPRAIAKGFEHIALPGVNRAMKNADAPAAKAISNSDNFLVRALKSPVIQKALVKTLGEEGAKKLSVKVAAKAIPGISTAYGLGEGLARIAMGDLKGGFLSFGSALPGAGYAFAAVDILRDINIDAYTKHIESNLPLPSNENFAAFFTEALGVTPDQYELGGTTGSQTVMLHGTELLIPPGAAEASSAQSVDPIGGTIIAATTQYINKLGPIGAPVAPMFKQAAAPLAEIYNVPPTLVQTNVGGSLPSLESTLKKVKEKRGMTPEEELSAMEKSLLEEDNPQSFADKLLKMIDPQGKFQELLQQINRPTTTPTDTTGVNGDLQGNIVNPMEDGDMQDYEPAKFGASRMRNGVRVQGAHQGRDIMGPAGTKVVAALPGKVIRIYNVGKLPGGGWSKGIDIEHENGIVTKYMHITPSVKQNDQVNAGQQIAVVSPEDDISQGSHLHFEIHKNGVAQNPESFLKSSYKLKDIKAGKVPGLSVQQSSPSPSAQPTGDVDVIIPLDHVKPGNQNKIPDTKGGNTYRNASATGADGRERQHQDKAAAKVKSKLEAKGLRVKIITPEDFGNYEDYDKYIVAQSAKGVRVVPLHFDAAVGQGGTGFLTRTRAGDSADAALASPIQQRLAKFQKANPSLGNLGPTDTASNATINRASAAPAALVEMGSMVAWEKSHGTNFTNTSKFNELATAIAEGIYQGGGFNTRVTPPTQRQPAQSKYYLKQGGDKNADTQILMIPAASAPGKAIEKNAVVEGQRFTYDASYNVFRTQNEISSVERAKLLRRLGLN